MYIKDIEEACQKILKGDMEALKQLGLDECTFPRPKPQSTASTTLQLQYNCTLNSAVAARELNLFFVEKQCQLTLEYIAAIAQAKKIRLEHSVDPQDVAEVMLTLIDLEKRKYWKEGDEGKHSQSDEEEDSELGEKEDVVGEGDKKESMVDEVAEEECMVGENDEIEDRVDEGEEEEGVLGEGDNQEEGANPKRRAS